MLQNLPPFSLPQLGQNHLAGAGAGAGLPHSEQNLPVLVAPQPVSYTHLDKWVLCHADSPKAAEGGYVGLIGKNLDITVD